jgi:hypothetical protein
MMLSGAAARPVPHRKAEIRIWKTASQVIIDSGYRHNQVDGSLMASVKAPVLPC